MVDPSEISANAKRFCFRTDRMNPLTLTSWSSNLQVSPVLLDWRICAHLREERECNGILPSLVTDVAKLRRHIRIAKVMQLLKGVQVAGQNSRAYRLVIGPADPRACPNARLST
jgi:hypothetical protein